MKRKDYIQLENALGAFVSDLKLKDGSNVYFKILKSLRALKTVTDEYALINESIKKTYEAEFGVIDLEKVKSNQSEYLKLALDLDAFALKQDFYNEFLESEIELVLYPIHIDDLDGSKFDVNLANVLIELKYIQE